VTARGRASALLASYVALACGPAVPSPARGFASSPLAWSSSPAAQSPSSAGPLPELAAELATTRGLELARLPDFVELPRAQLITAAVDLVRRTTPEDVRARAVRALSTLELAPADFDYLAAVERALTSSLHAFYDPDRRIIFVDRALAPADRERAATHELVHAAQFDVRSARDLRSTSDQHAALLTLAEGEAAFVTERLRPTLHDASDALGNDAVATDGETPAILLRSLAAPYVDGHAIVVSEYQRRGWAAIAALWSRLPLATHQLLHPDAARQPALLQLPPAPKDDGWLLRSSDVLGEQALRCVLEEWSPEPEARRVASAWIGDRLAWFEAGRDSVLIWALQFDGPTRAEEARQALTSGLRLVGTDVRHETGRRATALPCRAHRDSGVVGIMGQAEHVWLLALHGSSTEAQCRTLAEWSARVALRLAPTSTRVARNSPVAADP